MLHTFFVNVRFLGKSFSRVSDQFCSDTVTNVYTVGHKKRSTLFGIITPMFRGGFLHFLHQWKQEKILYQWITKFASLPELCLYTTWENLKTHKTAHFETNCQCILMLNAINGKNESKWTVFRVCAQNVHPLLAHRLPNTPLVDSIVNDLLLDFVPDG